MSLRNNFLAIRVTSKFSKGGNVKYYQSMYDDETFFL